jgi:hypothetical protein
MKEIVLIFKWGGGISKMMKKEKKQKLVTGAVARLELRSLLF